MKLLEYEAKQLLATYNIPTPTSQIVRIGDDTPHLPVVLKSQVPVGGRGKAGGIVVVRERSEYEQALATLLELPIKDFLPSCILAEALVSIKREFYLSLIIDKPTASIIVMAHTNGGVEVEENTSSDFLRFTLSPGVIETAGERLAEYYDLPDKTFLLQDLVKQLYECFTKNDALIIEINPLILTTDNTLTAGDCKMECDDSARFRHPDWTFAAPSAESNFVTLDEQGTTATLANGAGLAMATVDAVADAGLTPANFLDIGGGATTESILAAFERIMQYPNIQAIVINIFAGITRCDEVANAIISAKEQIDHLPPLSIRLAGTNFEQAAELLNTHAIPVLKTLEECIENVKREVQA